MQSRQQEESAECSVFSVGSSGGSAGTPAIYCQALSPATSAISDDPSTLSGATNHFSLAPTSTTSLTPDPTLIPAQGSYTTSSLH